MGELEGERGIEMGKESVGVKESENNCKQQQQYCKIFKSILEFNNHDREREKRGIWRELERDREKERENSCKNSNNNNLIKYSNQSLIQQDL
jgi:hypothetical protein